MEKAFPREAVLLPGQRRVTTIRRAHQSLLSPGSRQLLPATINSQTRGFHRRAAPPDLPSVKLTVLIVLRSPGVIGVRVQRRGRDEGAEVGAGGWANLSLNYLFCGLHDCLNASEENGSALARKIFAALTSRRE